MILFMYAPALPHGLPAPLRPSPTGYFGGLNGVDHYQQALRRARPIIAQWSEWEQQTRNPAWR